jgi:hypothetical protein
MECERCGQVKAIDHFSKNSRKNGGNQGSYCVFAVLPRLIPTSGVWRVPSGRRVLLRDQQIKTLRIGRPTI